MKTFNLTKEQETKLEELKNKRYINYIEVLYIRLLEEFKENLREFEELYYKNLNSTYALDDDIEKMYSLINHYKGFYYWYDISDRIEKDCFMDAEFLELCLEDILENEGFNS